MLSVRALRPELPPRAGAAFFLGSTQQDPRHPVEQAYKSRARRGPLAHTEASKAGSCGNLGEQLQLLRLLEPTLGRGPAVRQVAGHSCGVSCYWHRAESRRHCTTQLQKQLSAQFKIVEALDARVWAWQPGGGLSDLFWSIASLAGQQQRWAWSTPGCFTQRKPSLTVQLYQ